MELKSKFDCSVSLLCWAYNEEVSIAEYLEKATELMDASVEDYEIILIDDGSTDKTYEIAAGFRQKNPRLKIYRNERNLNVGISSQRAIQRASKEFLFWQTIDWCYDISNLRLYLEYLKKYDIVQGVREGSVETKAGFPGLMLGFVKLFGIRHLKRRSDTVQKGIISLINYILIRILFGVPLSDFQNVTFYPAKWIQAVNFESQSSFSNPEGLVKSYWRGMSIKEVPVAFIPREKGQAKGTKFKTLIRSVRDVLKLWFKWMVLGKREFTGKGSIEALKSGRDS